MYAYTKHCFVSTIAAAVGAAAALFSNNIWHNTNARVYLFLLSFHLTSFTSFHCFFFFGGEVCVCVCIRV